MPIIDKMQIGGQTYNIAIPEGLTEEEQAQIRANIGAAGESSTVVENGSYPDMTVGNANQLTNTVSIDGIGFNGSADVNHYGTCITGSTTATKSVNITGLTVESNKPVVGARITVGFTNANTVNSPTLNVNGTGAIAIKADGDITYVKWLAGAIMDFVYDGTNWVCIAGYALQGKPVGSHHTQFNGESTPASLFGGNWTIDTAYQGRVLIGSGGSYSLGANGGSADAVVVAHSHIQQTAISGNVTNWKITLNGDRTEYGYCPAPPFTEGYSNDNLSTGVKGESGVGKNMPPYIVVNVWKRTA